MSIDTEQLKTADRVWLRLALIVTDAGTQVRAKIDEDTVTQYAAEMVDGAKFPPVTVFHDGNQFVLADGFHRVMAASRNGFVDIESDIFKGTKSDALKFALKANSTHGLKRSNADKRRSVEMAHSEWPKMSGAELARVCAVSANFACEFLKAIQPSSDEGSTRIGADGKERKMPTPKPSMPTPAQAKAMMENVEKAEPTIQGSVAAKDATTQAPVASYSLKSFYAEAEGLAEIVLAEFNVTDLGHAAGHFEMLAAKIKRSVRERKAV